MQKHRVLKPIWSAILPIKKFVILNLIGNPEKSANSRFSIPKVLERNNKIQKNFVILSGSTMQSVRREESIYLKYSQFIMLIFTSKLKHRGRYGFIQSDKISIVNRLFDCTFALRASGMLRVTMFLI